MQRPAIPAKSAKRMQNRWYCRRFLATFLAAAPGSTKREFRIKRPTQEMLSVTTMAMAADAAAAEENHVHGITAGGNASCSVLAITAAASSF